MKRTSQYLRQAMLGKHKKTAQSKTHKQKLSWIKNLNRMTDESILKQSPQKKQTKISKTYQSLRTAGAKTRVRNRLEFCSL
jgi:hypothetical protein